MKLPGGISFFDIVVVTVVITRWRRIRCGESEGESSDEGEGGESELPDDMDGRRREGWWGDGREVDDDDDGHGDADDEGEI